jgi:hypothetical protein
MIQGGRVQTQFTAAVTLGVVEHIRLVCEQSGLPEQQD